MMKVAVDRTLPEPVLLGRDFEKDNLGTLITLDLQKSIPDQSTIRLTRSQAKKQGVESK